MNHNQPKAGSRAAPAGRSGSTDACGFVLIFLWALLTCGGMLMPNAEDRPVYNTLRTLAGKPVLGMFIMMTLMPMYLCFSGAKLIIETMWATTVGKIVLNTIVASCVAGIVMLCIAHLRTVSSPEACGTCSDMESTTPEACIGTVWAPGGTWTAGECQTAGTTTPYVIGGVLASLSFSCGGVLMPNAEDRPVYNTLRTLAGKPVLGAFIMMTLMPMYLPRPVIGPE